MRVDLNQNWSLREEELSVQGRDQAAVAAKQEGWMPCDLPCDIHQPLQRSGRIKDPVLADYSYDCQWTEKRSWWFKKDFLVESEALDRAETVELTIESIDARGEVFVNGHFLGLHQSAHFPFVADVMEILIPGTNRIMVRVTAGVETVPEVKLAEFEKNISTERDAGRGDRGDQRRAFVRKPQYVYGWDWGPRIATTGLCGSARLDFLSMTTLRRVHVATVDLSGDHRVARVRVEAEVENLHLFSTREATVQVVIKGPKGETAAVGSPDVLLLSGINHLHFDVELQNPSLWWPNGYGGQPLYLGEVRIACGEEEVSSSVRFGIRTIQLDTSRRETGGRRFAFLVNGTPVFCRGGNWVPPDSIYARVTEKKLAALVAEAQAAHFTMLRVWGGGVYERDAFYDLCDEAGILLWHDFMFACACYPDRDSEFVALVEREAEYQTKRLANHPSLALWCGSNENSWFFDEWWAGPEQRPIYPGGARIYNHILPTAVRRHCPSIPYWNSSPYGGERPNSAESGDVHHWLTATMSPNIEDRIRPEAYDSVTASFVSEYGYIGPCRKSSILEYHDGKPIDRKSRLWQHHNNTFEKDTVDAGIRKHYTDPATLDLDGYLLYGSLVQGLMYGYSLESFRSRADCFGGLFWMYTDCWGETGWTIIDYYLRRKPSWYAVKRAFSPRRLILRPHAQNPSVVRVILCNETAEPVKTIVRYGWAAFDGLGPDAEERSVEVPAFTRREVLSFSVLGRDSRRGTGFAVAENGLGFEPATVRLRPHRELLLGRASLVLDGFETLPTGALRFQVRSEKFAHAVHFGLPDEVRLSDEWFDLLPGEKRWVIVDNPPVGLDPHDIVVECVEGVLS
jgi:beta-mannosidase